MSDKERIFGPPGISALQLEHQSPPPPLQSEEQHITIESRLVFGQLVELLLQRRMAF